MLVNGTHLLPDLSGALWWPAKRLLAVADMHLEKGSAAAARGTLLPPYDTRTSLDRLAALLRLHQPKTVLCLGDSFHDKTAGKRLHDKDGDALRRMTATCDWVWIAGNHDPVPPAGLGGRVAEALTIEALTFRHAPLTAAAPGEIAGHLHPKAAVVSAGRRVCRPCFVTDGRRLIMPAFGAYAGGLDVLDSAFRPLFKRGFQVLMLGRDRIHTVPRQRLDGGERRRDADAGETGPSPPAGRRMRLFPE